jgi:hypothetical protein
MHNQRCQREHGGGGHDGSPEAAALLDLANLGTQPGEARGALLRAGIAKGQSLLDTNILVIPPPGFGVLKQQILEGLEILRPVLDSRSFPVC